MITEEFLHWLKTASGKELMNYKTDNKIEHTLVESELENRMEGNAENIVAGVFGFLGELLSEDGEA